MRVSLQRRDLDKENVPESYWTARNRGSAPKLGVRSQERRTNQRLLSLKRVLPIALARTSPYSHCHPFRPSNVSSSPPTVQGKRDDGHEEVGVVLGESCQRLFYATPASERWRRSRGRSVLLLLRRLTGLVDLRRSVARGRRSCRRGVGRAAGLLRLLFGGKRLKESHRCSRGG